MVSWEPDAEGEKDEKNTSSVFVELIVQWATQKSKTEELRYCVSTGSLGAVDGVPLVRKKLPQAHLGKKWELGMVELGIEK